MGRASRRKLRSGTSGTGVAATDPPMTPMAGATTWYETGPGPIAEDLSTAVLMVRVGMAANALHAQFHTIRQIGSLQGALRMMNVLCSLSTAIALTQEASRLASQGMPRLREFAKRAKAPEELLIDIGRLCSGNHPASKTLVRGRNQLGFHWDHDLVAQHLHEFNRNQKLIWVETNAAGHPVHRLASNVLAHALLDLNGEAGLDDQKPAISQAFSDVNNAIELITHFFTAATYGYLSSVNAERHERQ